MRRVAKLKLSPVKVQEISEIIAKHASVTSSDVLKRSFDLKIIYEGGPFWRTLS